MIIYKGTNNLVNGVFLKCFSIYTVVKLGITGQFITFIISVQSVYCRYSQTCVKRPHKTSIILAFQTGGCLLLHESSAESSCMSFLHYFHSAISNHLSIANSMSPE